MAVIAADKIIELSQAKDIKKAIIEFIGDISAVRVCGNNLFVATYIRPEKTAGGIYRPASLIKEDEYQGPIGLVMKLGEGLDEADIDKTLHHWVQYGYNDGVRFHYKGVPCRYVTTDRIRAFDIDPTKVL